MAVGTGGSVELWDLYLPDPARAIHAIEAAIGTTHPASSRATG
ncbi:hypothetical protein [Streptomyces caeruleatus]|nr:hypothetical protein [Streptomyces caeruleatus]